jgi:SpoVK/Ycf46/Vps4 family AAA+-type ATPase
MLSMDVSNLFNYAMVMFLMPALMTTIQSMVNSVINFISNKCNKYFNSGIDIKVLYTKDHCDSAWVPDKSNNHRLINLITKYIIDSGVKYEYAECDLIANFNRHNNGYIGNDGYDFPDSDDDCDDYDANDRKFMLAIKPFEKVKIDEYIIELYEDTPAETRTEKNQDISISTKKTERTITCNIKSTRGNKHVNEFLEKLLKDNENALMGISSQPKVYMQMKSERRIYFSKFSPVNNITFDNIFFDEKETLIELIDDFMAGKPMVRRLNLLLHGVPGCGKSSIIKAIANYTGYSIIVVKLSYISSDMDIFNVLFDPCISAAGNSDYIPINKRIYVFEDIDAESEIVHSRDNKQSKMCTNDNYDGEPIELDPPYGPTSDREENTTNLLLKAISTGGKSKDDSKITLSGLLNALDGVLEFNSIMIMTTNYPEKLDSALTRYGRFTMKIGLSYMAPENAHKLIKYYYPEYDNSFDIPTKITPATLTSYICCSRTLEKLKDVLYDHNEGII